MIKIDIRGRPSKITKKEAREALTWIGRELKIDRYKEPVRVNLNFIKHLKKKDKAIGFMSWEDSNFRPREFSVEIDADLSRLNSIKTIFHEAIHIRQYTSGRMVDYMNAWFMKKWCGKIINTVFMDYKDYPWEQEAYKLQGSYLLEYKKTLKKGAR